MDVKNTLINGDLSEKVYMQTPPGYTHSPHKIADFAVPCMDWNKALCAWFSKFSSTIAHIGFVSSSYDYELFIQRYYVGLILILIYVDDIIITGNDTIDIWNP